MVEPEPFITRRPVLFLIIFLIVLVLLYIPIRIAVKIYVGNVQGPQYLNESFTDTWNWFKSDSPLNIEEKRELFKIKYDNNIVTWEGRVLQCRRLENVWTVSIDETGSDAPDVIFSTLQNCSGFEPGKKVRYRMQLFDFRVNMFIGEKGVILTEDQ